MSELDSIRAHLERRFSEDRQRIVFWHDNTGEYRDAFEALDLPTVHIVRVDNNEYALKHRLLQQEPRARFLVYRHGPIPKGIDNWLLDLELAYGVFTADKTSLILQDLGVAFEGLRPVVEEHEVFFRSAKRTQELKIRLEPTDDIRTVQAKMVAILIGQKQHSLSEIWRALLEENARGESSKIAEIEKHGFAEYHWQGTKKIYGYDSTSPSVDDFVLWLFKNAINEFQSEIPNTLRNIRIDFGSLRYDSRFKQTYEVLARRAARDLDYEQTVAATDFRELIDNDLFDLVDLKVISELARGVAHRTLLAKDVSDWVRRRRSGFWFDSYKNLYSAIEAAASLLSAIEAFSPSIQSFDDGLEKYVREWFRIDQLYRRFVYHTRKAENSGPLEYLRDQVESFYSNRFLFPLGVEWQQQVDAVNRWRSIAVASQTSFFSRYVKSVISNGSKKAIVIVSDALRYEIADELRSRVRQEDRFDADLSAVLAVLPSHTQLGMAALLPHTTLSHAAGSKALVNVDGKPAGGTENRSKLLESFGGIAVQTEDLLKLSRDEARDLYRSHQVIYVYHNRIDETGDNAKSETRVFEAVEETITELVELIKTLVNANATNILVTADHGFLYQDSGLDETGYLSVVPQGDEIVYKDRRFVLGKGLKEDTAFKTFSPKQLGLDSDLEVQIPKSIHRLRLQGSGSRYVHGGASLQEVVVPVLTINKKRKSDLRYVEVQILPETNTITTGQIVIRLFQSDPVSDKVQPRVLKAGLYVGEAVISNEVLLQFSHDSEDKRERYETVKLVLSKEADDFNGRAVEFRLSEQIPNTSQWRVYAKVTYALKRSFMTDF